jgi:cell division protease FtsH
MYAGRAAEFLLKGNEEDITTGASNDLKQATGLIKTYIGEFGMGSCGLLSMSEFKDSDKDILVEAKELSKKLYQETVDFLKKNSDLLTEIAKNLVEKETISGDELKKIVFKTQNNELEKNNQQV